VERPRDFGSNPEWDPPYPRDGSNPEWDPPWPYPDYRWWADDMRGPHADADPNALASRGGCSLDPGGTSDAAGTLPFALLLGAALLIGLRLRQR
jgi:hypothetical protein